MMNPVKCPACDGRGTHPGSAPRKRVKCRGCGATGLVWLLPVQTAGAHLAELLRVTLAPQPRPDLVPAVTPNVPLMPFPSLPVIPTIDPFQPWQPNPGPWWEGPRYFTGDCTTGCVRPGLPQCVPATLFGPSVSVLS